MEYGQKYLTSCLRAVPAVATSFTRKVRGNLGVRARALLRRTARLAVVVPFAALLYSPSSALAQVSLGSAGDFAVLSAAPGGGGAVSCTDSTIAGDVGSSGLPASVVQVRCTITGAIIAPVNAGVLTDFNSAYDALADNELPAPYPCTGTLETEYTDTALTLTPGVYCNVAAVTFTNTTLTLDAQGEANAVWIFKIGTGGTGALTGTDFSVVMDGGQACNVYWWVAEAATLTRSDFVGTILAGAAISVTGAAKGPATPFEGRALAKAAVTLTDVALVDCEGGVFNPPQQRCNQGVGNGPENCDPGKSNQGDPSRSNDETGGTPKDPGRKGGNGK